MANHRGNQAVVHEHAGMRPDLPHGQRHYGLDWLRIAAFALLILYHIGMVFVPGHWVIKAHHSEPALIVPMALLTPWRLPLLFAVSGFASAMLFARSGGPARFARMRMSRLLVPLAFGMVALVPPELWVMVRGNGYPHGLLQFWLGDYWRWGSFYDVSFPRWEHLWFVAYLAVYTLLLAAILATVPNRYAAAEARIAAWLSVGGRLLWAPAVGLATAKLTLMFVVPESRALLTDWSGHAQFFTVFLFGFLLARRPELWRAIARWRRPALALAIVTGAVVGFVELHWPGARVPSHAVMALDRMAQSMMAWSMIIALLWLADRFANRDSRWRATLSEAVFPFYLVHHPAIVLFAWATLPLALSGLAAFAVITAGTVATCVAFYLIGREISWLRPLIGLRPRKPAAARAPRAVTAPIAEA